MGLELIIQTIIFCLLVALSVILFRKREKKYFSSKSISYWIVDIVGLILQGVFIPLLHTFLVSGLLHNFFPGFNGIWKLGALESFLLNFVIVDYIYYWFHRFYHTRKYWALHLLHHTAEEMDIFVSSRNNIWISFLLPYLWFNGFFYYLVSDKNAYALALITTAMLDLWRHSELVPIKKNIFFSYLSQIFITPYEHAWHHSRTKSQYNFGANFSLWDKFHKTYYSNETYPRSLGFKVKSDIVSKLFRPYKMQKDHL